MPAHAAHQRQHLLPLLGLAQLARGRAALLVAVGALALQLLALRRVLDAPRAAARTSGWPAAAPRPPRDRAPARAPARATRPARPARRRCEILPADPPHAQRTSRPGAERRRAEGARVVAPHRDAMCSGSPRRRSPSRRPPGRRPARARCPSNDCGAAAPRTHGDRIATPATPTDEPGDARTHSLRRRRWPCESSARASDRARRIAPACGAGQRSPRSAARAARRPPSAPAPTACRRRAARSSSSSCFGAERGPRPLRLRSDHGDGLLRQHAGAERRRLHERDLRCDAAVPRVERRALAGAAAGHYRVGVDFPERCADVDDRALPAARARPGVREELAGEAAFGRFDPRVLDFEIGR